MEKQKKIKMIETHAHIYSEQFKDDIEHVLDLSRESGVEKIYMPNIDHASIDGMLALEERHPGFCIATMGLHPCSVKGDFQKELYIIEEWLGKREFVAIGEMGTDLYWDKSFLDQQVEAFKIQVAWAKHYKKPIIIHCRESIDLTIKLVETLKDDDLTGVFHCFNGTVEQAERITKLGFYVGLGGVVTFKNSGMDEVIPSIDLKHIVLETDSPYLAPVPHRGKRNQPNYLGLIAQKIADVRKLPIEAVIAMTTENANTLFQAS